MGTLIVTPIEAFCNCMRAGTGICSSIPDPEGYRIKLAVILASHMIKNAEKFCGHGKFGVVVDTYLKSL